MGETRISSSHSSSAIRVLLVGGSAEDADRLRQHLEGSTSCTFAMAHTPHLLPAEEPSEIENSDALVLRLGDGSSLELAALAKLRARAPMIPIIALGSLDEEAFALEALRCGAAGFLLESELGTRSLVTTLTAALESHKAIRQLRQARERALHLATHDPLTNLANRAAFKHHLSRAVAAASRRRRKLAVLFADVEGFQTITETLGHEVGNLLVREIAERLVRNVRLDDAVGRSANESEASISRVEGGEFTVLLAEIADAQDAARVTARVLDVLSEPFVADGREVFVSLSIGIAVYPCDGEDADALLSHAKSAMVQARSQGRNSYHFYDRSMNAEASRKLQLESQLYRALDRDELSLHYQPLRDAASGRLIGAEALLRWEGPETGRVSPVEFIPIAEETGLIIPIGEWVLRTACAQSQAWQAAGMRAIRLAVNLSGHQLRRSALVEMVRRTLEESGLSPTHLELEITESTIMRNDEDTIACFRELHDMGVGIALDDFGTGYSALSYLRRLPIDRLKIDRSFVGEIATNRDDAALAVALIAMAHSLQLGVVAEGVETREQADFLRAHGCDELQGFLFSPAVPPEEFTRFLEREKDA